MILGEQKEGHEVGFLGSTLDTDFKNSVEARMVMVKQKGQKYYSFGPHYNQLPQHTYKSKPVRGTHIPHNTQRHLQIPRQKSYPNGIM